MINFNINKNNTLTELQDIVEQNINQKLHYMSDSFNEQQQLALQLFKQRIFLEQTIDETITFNKNLVFENSNKNLYLATSAESLIDVFKLRSDVLTQINYQSQFPDTIEGLNFDKFDTTSAILYYKTNETVTGTIRLIFDSQYKLPSDDNFSFEDLREKHNTIGELSRLMIKNEKKGLNLEFKNLFAGIYHIFNKNKIDIVLSCIKKEHNKLYSKFGGSEIINSTDQFANLGLPIDIITWDPSQASKFFKKAFLN